MIKGVKICGISDLKTLSYIIKHPYPPQFIGFITNYKKSKRYIEFEKLKELINIDKKGVNFVSGSCKLKSSKFISRPPENSCILFSNL